MVANFLVTSARTTCTCIRKHSVILLTDRKENTQIKPGIFTTCMLNQRYKNNCDFVGLRSNILFIYFIFLGLEIKYLSHD